MSVTVFLGGFGFGNLGDEACLATAYKEFKGDTNCCFSFDPVITGKAAPFDFFFRDLPELLERFSRIDRVVIAGGGVGFMPSFKDNLDWAMHCQGRGAEVIIHNIGIGKIGSEWTRDFPDLVSVIKSAKVFSVRDHRSRHEVESWGIGLSPEVSFYPERNHPVSPALSYLLPEKQRYLGLSVNNRPQLWRVLQDNRSEIKSMLNAYPDSAIVPVVSTIHALDAHEHDDEGFCRFVAEFGLHSRVVAKELAVPAFWREHVGPADVKYVISRCSVLLSARKHNIIHAIGARTPFVGLFEFDNDSIPRVYQTLFPALPPGSCLFPLYPA
jgi:polysaccharide pyruvyl transferase WcaK-like protein